MPASASLQSLMAEIDAERARQAARYAHLKSAVRQVGFYKAANLARDMAAAPPRNDGRAALQDQTAAIGQARAMLRQRIVEGQLTTEQAARSEHIINAQARQMVQPMAKSMSAADRAALHVRLVEAARGGADPGQVARIEAQLHRLGAR